MHRRSNMKQCDLRIEFVPLHHRCRVEVDEHRSKYIVLVHVWLALGSTIVGDVATGLDLADEVSGGVGNFKVAAS